MNFRISKWIILFAVAFSLTAKAASVAPPPVLITIDDSDPSAMLITATGAFAATTNSSTDEEAGIDLLNFLTASIVADPISDGGLRPAGGTLDYNSWQIDSESGSSVDFHIYRDPDGGGVTQDFTTDSAAFTGSWTIDVSGLSGQLPLSGTSGDILSGYSGDEGVVIGQWVAVPEPSPYGLFAFLGLAALVAQRKFSRSHRVVTVR